MRQALAQTYREELWASTVSDLMDTGWGRTAYMQAGALHQDTRNEYGEKDFLQVRGLLTLFQADQRNPFAIIGVLLILEFFRSFQALLEGLKKKE